MQLLMVLLFNVLFLMLLGVAWRHIAAVIRVATVREQQVQRDEGSLRVLAIAMQVLETRFCMSNGVANFLMPDGSYYPADGANFSLCNKCSNNTWYQVTFTRNNSDGTEWKVNVVAVSTSASVATYPALPYSYP